MRNQYKVLSEKYELQVEVPTREEKAIYNTKALTQDFLPTAIKIYRDQVEPIIRSWPDFDIMTDVKFPHNILINASGYQGAAIRNLAYWAHIYLYKPQDYPRNDVDAILERWFVHSLFERVYKGYQSDSPKSFYKDVQTGRIPPQKSNADFIQYLIKLAVAKMKTMYDVNHRKAVADRNAIEDWKRSQEIHQKSTDITGIDTSGLVEAKTSPREKAIYDTTALTQNFIPVATNIYKTQVEPKIKSWPDFDIMTDINFSHNIINTASNYAGLISRFLYKSQGLAPMQPGDVDAILARWFVYHLHAVVHDVDTGHPFDYYKLVQNGLMYPQKSNADFIQSLINVAVQKMEEEYKNVYEIATETGDLADWKRSQDIHQKSTDITGVDTSGLLEANVSQDPEEVAEQIIDRAKVATQGYIKLLNNKRVPGIKLAEYVRQHIHPIIQEILSYVTDKNPHKKAQLENYLKELLTTTWLTVDRVYWDVEMDTIVRGAVEDGEAIIQDIEKMANRGNKIIDYK